MALLFPTLFRTYLGDFIMLPFSLLLLAFFVFVYLFLPETKGRQVGDTTALLANQGRGRISIFRNSSYEP